MSTETLERPKTAPRPRGPDGSFLPAAKAVSCPISVEAMQAHLDQMAKGMTLPTLKPGAPPLEPDVDHRTGEARKDDNGRVRMRPRSVCQLDKEGNVVPFSGVVITPEFANAVWELLLPHLEYFAGFTLTAMAQDLLRPNSDGEINDVSRLVVVPDGRFVFAHGHRPLTGR